MPDPEILPDPDGQRPTQPSELPPGGRPGLDIPELPDEGEPLENDVEIGPGGLEIGPR